MTDKLKLHSRGRKDHIAALRQALRLTINRVSKDASLNKDEKAQQIRDLKRTFRAEKKQSTGNLY